MHVKQFLGWTERRNIFKYCVFMPGVHIFHAHKEVLLLKSTLHMKRIFVCIVSFELRRVN